MKTNILVPSLLLASLALVAIPQASSAETLILEARETRKGKQPLVHRFSVDVADDRPSELEWSSDKVRFTFDINVKKQAKSNERRIRYVASARGGKHSLELKSVVKLSLGKRHVIGRAQSESGSLELALTVAK